MLSGCGRKEATVQAQPTTVVIGGIYPLTGPLSVFGQAAKDGLTDGVAYANRAVLSGTPYVLEAVVEDSRGEPTAGVTAYRRVRETKKAAVFNAILSNVAVALKPLADQDGVLLFADSTHSSLHGGMTLRHSQTAEQEAEFLLAHCTATLKASTVLGIIADDDYGESFVRVIGSRAKPIRFPAQAPDVAAVAVKAAEENPDAVIVVGLGGTLGEIIRQLRERGYKGHIVCPLAFDAVPSTRKVAGDAAKGVWYSRLVQDAQSVSAVVGKDVAVPGLSGASAMKIVAFNDAVFVAQALKAGKTSPQAIRDYILSQKTLDGVGTTAQPQTNGTLLPRLEMVQEK
jgi:branched-chain amino acid transport system substrate-binding protein